LDWITLKIEPKSFEVVYQSIVPKGKIQSAGVRNPQAAADL
jgi:hypothetical protein